mgnify:CR=1 FL=1
MHHSFILDFKRTYYKYIYLIIICLFLGVCKVYLILEEVDKYGSGENRLMSTIPNFPLNKKEYLNFSNNFDEYLKDNIGLRSNLIHYYNQINHYIFKNMSTSNIVRGKNDFLFLNQDGNSISDHLGYSKHRTELELEQFAKRIQETHDYIESKGIPYVFILAPNKISIYPENLPDKFIYNKHRIHNTDQLLNYLKANTNVTIIDLREIMIETKKICKPYGQFDSHWNECAASAAYKYIIDYIDIKKKIKFNKINYSLTLTKNCDWGDLVRMYTKVLPGTLHRIRDGCFRYNTKFASKSCNPKRSKGRWFFTITCDKNYQYKKAIIFHDSFFSQLAPFFSRSFNNSSYVLNRLTKGRLQKELFKKELEACGYEACGSNNAILPTDLVIEQWVERYFNSKGHAFR